MTQSVKSIDFVDVDGQRFLFAHDIVDMVGVTDG